MKYILAVENLKKTYQTGEVKTNALRGVDFRFAEDRFYAIVGKSGSGKSTLLHLLGGLDRPTEGRILFQGKDISKLRDMEISKIKREKFGFIFQSYNLLPELCALENILLPLYLSNQEADKKYLNQVMKSLGLEDKKRKYPSQLSGGEQQRVAIARAMINKPKIIFADEPTGNLDQSTGEEVADLLIETGRKFSQTIILVTHDTDLAKRADEIIYLQDGRIVQGE